MTALPLTLFACLVWFGFTFFCYWVVWTRPLRPSSVLHEWVRSLERRLLDSRASVSCGLGEVQGSAWARVLSCEAVCKPANGQSHVNVNANAKSNFNSQLQCLPSVSSVLVVGIFFFVFSSAWLLYDFLTTPHHHTCTNKRNTTNRYCKLLRYYTDRPGFERQAEWVATTLRWLVAQDGTGTGTGTPLPKQSQRKNGTGRKAPRKGSLASAVWKQLDAFGLQIQDE